LEIEKRLGFTAPRSGGDFCGTVRKSGGEASSNQYIEEITPSKGESREIDSVIAVILVTMGIYFWGGFMNDESMGKHLIRVTATSFSGMPEGKTCSHGREGVAGEGWGFVRKSWGKTHTKERAAKTGKKDNTASIRLRLGRMQLTDDSQTEAETQGVVKGTAEEGERKS